MTQTSTKLILIYQVQAYLILLRFALLGFTDVSVQVESKTLHQQKKMMTCFTVIRALLRWSGNKPTISLRFAWTSKFLDERQLK